MNCVYMLLCNDQSFYTGWTNDLAARLAAHDECTASKYTRSKRPLQCILVIYCNSATQARSVEAKIKRLQRKDKERILGDTDQMATALWKMTGETLYFARSFIGIE
jgi:putative endonuclease